MASRIQVLQQKFFSRIASDLNDILLCQKQSWIVVIVPAFGMPTTKIGVGSGSLQCALKVSGLLVKLLVDSMVEFGTSSVEFEER
jgi:hypothetical protein